MKLVETKMAKQGQIYSAAKRLRTPQVDYHKQIAIWQAEMVRN
jgi:hypothetical protein